MNEFSNEEWSRKFRDDSRKVIKELGDYFIKEADTKQREKIADFLLEFADKGFFPKRISLCTIHILRQYSQTTKAAINLSQRAVVKWPRDFSLRYTLSNCLNMSESRECYFEGLKQRIIGCKINLIINMRKNKRSIDYHNIISQHFGRLEDITAFIQGNNKYPSKSVGKMINSRREAGDDLLKILRNLESIGDLLNLPQQRRIKPKVVCILDTNAISKIEVSKHFMNCFVQYLVPPEILLELSDWYKLQRIPWEFEFVKIQEVNNSIPIEIDNMMSKFKGKVPSLPDKMVATLAYESRANLIVSDDRDLWDSGMTYQIEKNYGHRIEVIRPANYKSWLYKHNLLQP